MVLKISRIFIFMNSIQVKRIVVPDSHVKGNWIRMQFPIRKNAVHPSASLLTCIVYKNGDAVLRNTPQSWKNDEITVDFWLDEEYCNTDDIEHLLVSPSYGNWEVASIQWINNTTESLSEFVATNLEENCEFVLKNPDPPSNEKIQEGLNEYKQTKLNILTTQIALIGLGASGLNVLDPSDIHAKWFVMGGFAGLMYQILIQMEIDQVGNENKGLLYKLLANSFFRLSFMTSLFVLTAVDTATMDTSTFASIMTGFLMNKIAMYIIFWRSSSRS